MTTAPLSHKKHGYSSLQIALHWSVVGLVAFQWFLGQVMERAFDARMEGQPVDGSALGGAYVHIALGIAILIVMAMRLTVKLRRPVQVAPQSDHNWARVLGSINHWAFYVILIALPLGGLVAWFGGSEAAGSLHGLLANVLPWLIALHVGGALVHQFVFRDGDIRRIVRPGAGT